MTASRSRPGARVALVLAAVLVAGAGLTWAGTRDAGDSPASASAPRPSATPAASPTTAEARAWRELVVTDFQQLAGSAFSAVRTASEWDQGRAAASDVRDRAFLAVDGARVTVGLLAQRAPLPGAERALLHYRAAADLYRESMVVLETATSVQDGPLQTQLRRAYARTRNLGDRLYDQGGRTLVPFGAGPQQLADGVELPPDVPDHDAMELGVGAPLEPAEPPSAPPRTYEADRPEQPAAAWSAAVRGLDAPTARDVARLLDSGTTAALAAAARRAVAASDVLHAEPDPAGDRQAAVAVSLGLLVDADALRLAQAALLLPTEAARLRSSARALHGVAAALRAVSPSDPGTTT